MTTTEDTTTEVEETEGPVTVSAKEVAARVGVDPKAFRRWLRRVTDNRAGKGGRWSFSEEEAEELVARFQADAEKAKAKEDEDIEDIEDLEDLDELEDLQD